MKRVMCVWFPNWPIQRRLTGPRSDRSRPVVVYGPASGGKTRVIACSRGACERGVRPGMLLVEAQALWPAAAGAGARFEPHEPRDDRRELRELAWWCQQFSPVVALDAAAAPDCLLLDATGCGRGEEERLAQQVVESFRRRGYRVIAVSADSVGAAWAVAHFGRFDDAHRAIVVPPGGCRDALRPLPVEALRLPENVAATLHELNVFRCDQLFALPREELPSRFGAELLLHIDRALGTTPELLVPERLDEPLEACWQFEPPIADGRALVSVIEHLLERLLERIPCDHFGVQRLLCSLKLAGHEPIGFPVELLRPTASQRDLMELVRLQIERLRLPAEVVETTLRAEVIRPLEFRQDELFGGGEAAPWRQEAIGLLERLSSRLGEQAVRCPRLWPDAQPELAQRYQSWRDMLGPASRKEKAVALVPTAPRPLFLKKPPVGIAVTAIWPGGAPRQFRCAQRPYDVAHWWGPERIETGWWREADVRRDYFVVETAEGERFWLFHDLIEGPWYLHGAFA
jgi:protein ImuB